MTTDTNEALAGELRGFAALLQGHPDIEDQLIRLPGTSEVIDLREVLDTLSERIRQAADMLVEQAAKLVEMENEVRYFKDSWNTELHRAEIAENELASVEADADQLAEALEDCHPIGPTSSKKRCEALAAHRKRRAG